MAHRVYTRSGDSGVTLTGFGLVSKNHGVIALLGEMDLLSSSLGLVIQRAEGTLDCQEILRAQQLLHFISGVMAEWPSGKGLLLTENDVLSLESAMDLMSMQLPPLGKFILPNGKAGVSEAHVARCICRQ
eukprot:3934541-Rhodomonas_salina.1